MKTKEEAEEEGNQIREEILEKMEIGSIFGWEVPGQIQRFINNPQFIILIPM